ncbi:MAG: hypothetical protein ACREOU_01760 [Candidatus Eiseniibacteriota bacterium]
MSYLASVFSAGLFALCVAGRGDSGPKPFGEDQSIVRVIHGSRVVVLARVIELDSVASLWPPTIDSTTYQLYRRRAVLEPIEYIKGGLDGDVIVAYNVEVGKNPADGGRLGQLAGVDTLAAFFFLTTMQGKWYIPRAEWPGPVPQGVPIAQRSWSAQVARLKVLADSVAADSSRVAAPNRSAR